MIFSNNTHGIKLTISEETISIFREMLKNHITIGAGLGSNGNRNEDLFISDFAESFSFNEGFYLHSLKRVGNDFISVGIRHEMPNDEQLIWRGDIYAYRLGINDGSLKCYSEGYFCS